MNLTAGTRLGPYEILAPLGAGGMGEVYRARDTRLDRAVAIKVMRSSATAGADMRERFRREARAIAQLSHPNICTLHDVGDHEGMAFLVMEYLEGETLATRLSRQKARSSRGDTADRTSARTALPLDETLRIAAQLADALAAAHRAGIVHRDLKPGNIMLTRSVVKVVDFGLARFQPSTPLSEVNGASTVAARSLTSEGTFVGTIPYMAPEQLEGRSIDARTDIFAFGAILYEMTTGRRAFTGDSPAGLIAAILEREPPPVTDDEPRTPRSLERLARKCLAKNPEARWQSASDIADELRWIAPGGDTAAGSAAQAPPGRRRWWTTAAVVVTGAMYLLRDQNDATEILRLTPSSAGDLSGVVLTSVADGVAAPNCSISDRGDRMLYSRAVAHSNIWRLDLRIPTQPAVSLTRGTSLLNVPRVSPDGQWIVASQGSGPNSRIVRFPANGGEPFQLTSGTIGVLSPTGRQLAFVSGRTTQNRVWTSDADGLSATELQDAVTANPTTIAWLPDGRLAWQTPDGVNYRIRNLANGQEELLMGPRAGGYPFHPHFSPNGEQVAIFRITGNGGSRTGLWVLSWPSREPRFLTPNLDPIGWSQDSEWIYAFQDSTSALVRVSPRTSKVEPIGSFPRGSLTLGSCSLTPDRQAIICALTDEHSDAWIIDDFDPDVQSERR